jgi:uncharacterized integral membrane protein (TIGR00698 family)
MALGSALVNQQKELSLLGVPETQVMEKSEKLSAASAPRFPAALETSQRLAPGLLLSAAVAIASTYAEPAVAAAIRSLTGAAHGLPAIVIALILGIVLHPFARRDVFQPGITFAVKTLLRFAIALLGLRIALGDIVGLGFYSPALIVVAMISTVAVSMFLAKLLGRRAEMGALAGMATAVCGASAALATSTVLPNYPNKQADVAFAVVAANAVSTAAMVLYPPLCTYLGLSTHDSGILLGGTIHDMAQVVGAGYSVSTDVGNTAVIVKLFRIFLLLPMVVSVGWWLHSRSADTVHAKVPVPFFAFVFVILCIVNSFMPTAGTYGVPYVALRDVLNTISTWGLLIAIAALGLGTSIVALFSIGWRHLLTFMVATVLILAVVTAGLTLPIRSFF